MRRNIVVELRPWTIVGRQLENMTGLTGAIKTLRKAFTNATNETLGGAHRGKTHYETHNRINASKKL